MDEASFMPNIEPSPGARDMETVRMLDRVLVRIVLHEESVEHIATLIDEMDAIFSHQIFFLVDDGPKLGRDSV